MVESQTNVAEQYPRSIEPGQIDVSIVIPCYRDETNIARIFDRLGPVMDEIPGICELVLVDDGSPDRTSAEIIERSRAFGHPVTSVRLARNFGQHPAVFAGLEQSRGKVVVTMDSDLQYPPEEIQTLLDALGDGFEVAAGRRANRRDPIMRRVITRALGWWLGRRTGSTMRDVGSMFRAYDRRVVDQLLQFREQRRFIPGLVAWLGVPVREVPIKHEVRGDQGSRYRLGPLVDMLFDMVTGYSVAPLRALSLLAFVGSALGFIATMGFFAYRVLVGGGISGTVSAFALVFLLLGIQLALTAMLSEYAGRTHSEVKERPYFIVGSVSRNW